MHDQRAGRQDAASAVDGDRGDRRPGVEREVEAALLERAERAGLRAGPLRRDPDADALLEGVSASRRLATAAARSARSITTNPAARIARPQKGTRASSFLATIRRLRAGTTAYSTGTSTWLW
jgi:hypothetical protein